MWQVKTPTSPTLASADQSSTVDVIACISKLRRLVILVSSLALFSLSVSSSASAESSIARSESDTRVRPLATPVKAWSCWIARCLASSGSWTVISSRIRQVSETHTRGHLKCLEKSCDDGVHDGLGTSTHAYLAGKDKPPTSTGPISSSGGKACITLEIDCRTLDRSVS